MTTCASPPPGRPGRANGRTDFANPRWNVLRSAGAPARSSGGGTAAAQGDHRAGGSGRGDGLRARLVRGAPFPNRVGPLQRTRGYAGGAQSAHDKDAAWLWSSPTARTPSVARGGQNGHPGHNERRPGGRGRGPRRQPLSARALRRETGRYPGYLGSG